MTRAVMIVTMTAAGNANAARIAVSGAERNTERNVGNGTMAMTEVMEMGMAEATTTTIEPCWRIR